MPTRPEQPTLAAVVRAQLGEGTSWSAARKLVRSGRVWVEGSRVTDPAARVEPDSVSFDTEAPRLRRGVLPDEAIVHVDAHVVVVAKPAGMLSVPFAPDDRDTLVDQLRAALRRRARHNEGSKRYDPELGIVHRIDKGTTGLLVFTRTLAAKRHLAQQFRAHTVVRTYLALCHGVPKEGTFETSLLRDRGDGLRGSFGAFRRAHGEPPRDARRAITHVDAVIHLEGPISMSLVALRLETGRQHQIRIHLSEAGHPLIGEHVYIRDFDGPSLPEVGRPLLHAAELGFAHPANDAPARFVLPPPEDFLAHLPGDDLEKERLWQGLIERAPNRRHG